jgi:hypothetical protein
VDSGDIGLVCSVRDIFVSVADETATHVVDSGDAGKFSAATRPPFILKQAVNI